RERRERVRRERGCAAVHGGGPAPQLPRLAGIGVGRAAGGGGEHAHQGGDLGVGGRSAQNLHKGFRLRLRGRCRLRGDLGLLGDGVDREVELGGGQHFFFCHGRHSARSFLYLDQACWFDRHVTPTDFPALWPATPDRKSTRLNSSHVKIS